MRRRRRTPARPPRRAYRSSLGAPRGVDSRHRNGLRDNAFEVRQFAAEPGGIARAATQSLAEEGARSGKLTVYQARQMLGIRVPIHRLTSGVAELAERVFRRTVLHSRRVATPPNPTLLTHLAPYDRHISDLALALREIVLEEAPEAVESIVKSYAVSIGFSFTGKPLKDGFCHIVVYSAHVNLGFNRGALLPDPNRLLEGSGKMIRHLTFRHPSDLENPYLRRFLATAIEQAARPQTKPETKPRAKRASR